MSERHQNRDRRFSHRLVQRPAGRSGPVEREAKVEGPAEARHEALLWGERATVPFNGTLLKPLGQQHDLDGDYIDPRGVRFDPERDYPVSINFDYGRIVGTARISRRPDGGLVARGRLAGPIPLSHLAIGVRVHERVDQTITLSDLMVMALTDRHADPDQPFVWIDEG